MAERTITPSQTSSDKDLVEQIKAEVRENDDIPTRSRVLDLAKQRKKNEEEAPKPDDLKTEDYNKYLDFCGKVANHFNKVIYDVAMLDVGDQRFEAWKVLLDNDQTPIQKYIDRINEGILTRYFRGTLNLLLLCISGQKKEHGSMPNLLTQTKHGKPHFKCDLQENPDPDPAAPMVFLYCITEGVHFFKLEDELLMEFKNQPTISQSVSKHKNEALQLQGMQKDQIINRC